MQGDARVIGHRSVVSSRRSVLSAGLRHPRWQPAGGLATQVCGRPRTPPSIASTESTWRSRLVNASHTPRPKRAPTGGTAAIKTGYDGPACAAHLTPWMTLGMSSTLIDLVPRRAPALPTATVASRVLPARIQHWTVPIIGNHLALDSLVMRRSGVRFPEAAPYSP